MRKPFLLASIMTCLTTPAFAELTPVTIAPTDLIAIGQNKFIDKNLTIEYPCSSGGEPLVIYSVPVYNLLPVSSKKPIAPRYVKPGYHASKLVVGQNTQSDKSSLSELIIKTANPSYSNNYVGFSLTRDKDQEFYVDTVNFGSVKVEQDDQFVSSARVTDDQGQVLFQSITPSRMQTFDQDWGIMLFQSVKQINAFQYAWNQKANWRDENGEVQHMVRYKFTPQKQEDTSGYNGFGFWICGSDSESASNGTGLNASKQKQKAGSTYTDKVK